MVTPKIILIEIILFNNVWVKVSIFGHLSSGIMGFHNISTKHLLKIDFQCNIISVQST